MEKILIFESKEEAERIVPLRKIRKLDIKNRNYCITRTSEGFTIIDRECPHSGHDLSEGAINAYNEVVCPSHSFRFQLKTGECDRPCADLKLYTCFWEGDMLFVSL